jgi:hypothetical protein
MLLTDEAGFITNITSNIKKRYTGSNEITNRDCKVHIDEIFPELN